MKRNRKRSRIEAGMLALTMILCLGGCSEPSREETSAEDMTAFVSEADSSEVDSSEADSSEAGSSEADSSEAGSSETDNSEVGSSEVGSSEVDSSEADKVELSQNEMEPWQKAYLELLQEEEINEHYYHGELIYIDDDEIPELVLYGSSEADSTPVYTWWDGKLNDIILNRLRGGSYKPQTGMIDNFNGHMGSFGFYLYELKDGAFTLVYEGCYEDMSGVGEGDDFISNLYCEWEGTEVTVDELMLAMSEAEAAYEGGLVRLGTYEDPYCMKTDELIAVLESGKVDGIPLDTYLSEKTEAHKAKALDAEEREFFN